MKFIPKTPGADRELQFEELVDVPNVVPVLDHGDWDGCWVLVMPKAEKSLREQIEVAKDPLPLGDAIQVLIDVSQALVAIEGSIVHRDLKPENILFFGGSWCIADFGISRYAAASTAADTRKYSMTHPYAAPEQWRGGRATTATDVYALGIIGYELLAGERPFTGPAEYEYRQQHLESKPNPIPAISTPLQSLLEECLFKNPEARPRPKNLLERLRRSPRGETVATRQLQQANALAVGRRAESERIKSIEKSRIQRRTELLAASRESMKHVADQLQATIGAHAPSTEFAPSRVNWKWALNDSRLELSAAEPVYDQSDIDAPFEVIAISAITLRIPTDRRGYEGRSHSLWYCDPEGIGSFRWYEIAFIKSPLMGARSSIAPFALDPCPDAYIALSSVMGVIDAAWTFNPIDQGDEDGFIDRWVEWFANAAQGNLTYPSSLPEKRPYRKWNRRN